MNLWKVISTVQEWRAGVSYLKGNWELVRYKVMIVYDPGAIHSQADCPQDHVAVLITQGGQSVGGILDY